MKNVASSRSVNCMFHSMAQRMGKIGLENSCIVGILKGGIYTTINILNLIEKSKILIGFIGLSSYKDGIETTEKMDITYSLDLDSKLTKGKKCWIVDDIYDSGLTLQRAVSIIKQEAQFESIHSAVLVRKMKPKIQVWKSEKELPDVVGLEYEGDGFLVGCGMGMDEKYRCLDEIFELEEGEVENV